MTLTDKIRKVNIEPGSSFHQLLLMVVLVAAVAGLSISSPFFLKWDNMRNILDQSVINIIIGAGMTYVISSGGIDLSVGAAAAVCGVIIALLLKAGLPVFPAAAAGLLAGALLGGANGLMVSRLKVNPFIVTLASMSVFRGLTLILTKSIPIYSFPTEFTWLGSGSVIGMPVPVIITLAVVALAWTTIRRTRLGYYTMAIGGNEEALRRTGVSVDYYKTAIYMISGFTAALAGLIVTARLNSADPLAGYMYELDAIATVILGGTSIKGGHGSMAGTVIAGLFLSVVRNGLTINGIASYCQQLLVGLIILFAVVISERSGRRL
ncbi:ABC transporter permease [Peptoclostridium sp.]|uniref:ABC transporter permease n=1 Tax=Peptoclostridium sp. TaxID=1904860 RepID=UPI0025DFCB7E|nr:ABC transporter permease [Peptoclostridium sp.]